MRSLLQQIVALLLVGCAVHTKALVQSSADDRTRIVAIEGTSSWRLASGPPERQLAHLDGYVVEVWGKGTRNNLSVHRFKIVFSPSGLTVVMGPLRVMDGRLLVEDRTTVGFVWLDEQIVIELLPFVGQTVLVEGYVDGAQRLKVVKYRVLAAPLANPHPSGD